MATFRPFGAEGYRFAANASGKRFIWLSNPINWATSGEFADEGVFINVPDASGTSPANAALRDMAGQPLNLELKTNSAFGGSVALATTSENYGYDFTLSSGAVNLNDRAFFTSSTAEIEISGFQANDVLDVAMYGFSGAETDRGGVYRILGADRECEVINSPNNNQGPVIFRDVAPSGGSLKIEFVSVTNFIYFNMLDITIKQR